MHNCLNSAVLKSVCCTVSCGADEDTKASSYTFPITLQLVNLSTVLKVLAWVTAQCPPWFLKHLAQLGLYIQYAGRDVQPWEGETEEGENTGTGTGNKKKGNDSLRSAGKEGKRSGGGDILGYLLHAMSYTIKSHMKINSCNGINSNNCPVHYFPQLGILSSSL